MTIIQPPSDTSDLRRVDRGPAVRVRQSYSKCFLNCEHPTEKYTPLYLNISCWSQLTFIPFVGFEYAYHSSTSPRLFDGSLKCVEHKLCNVFSFGRICVAFDKFSVSLKHPPLWITACLWIKLINSNLWSICRSFEKLSSNV